MAQFGSCGACLLCCVCVYVDLVHTVIRAALLVVDLPPSALASQCSTPVRQRPCAGPLSTSPVGSYTLYVVKFLSWYDLDSVHKTCRGKWHISLQFCCQKFFLLYFFFLFSFIF